MKRLLFCILLFISTISFAQTQKITPEFRAVIPGTSHADPVIYYYPGKFGGYDTLVNLNYLRSHFAALNDSLVFSNWFTGLGTGASPLYIKRDSIFHLTAGTNISITGTPPNYIINAAGGSSLTGPGYVKMVSGSPTYITSIPNADLANAYVTVNGSIVNLGSAITITAATPNALTNGWGINAFSFNGSSAGIQVKADTSSGKLATQYYASVVVGADGIVTGLVTTTVTTTATTTAGTYRLNNALVTKSTSTNTTIPAQDATLNRYTLIVGDASGVLSAVNGTLSADAVEPDIPTNKALIASIYIPATGGTVTTGGGGSTKGTVTKVSSSTTDILVANQTTTPILTLNKVHGVPITYYDPTSSIQTQLNGKQATLVSGTSIKTINSVSLLGSGNILLQTPLTAGTDYLAPTGSAAGLTGLTSGQVTGALGFTPENAANKSTTTILGTSNTLYPTQNAVKTYVDNAVSGSGFSNPMTTTGDIIYSSSGSTPARLGIGSANTLLHGGTTPSYSAIVNNDITNGTIDLTTKVTGILPNANTTATSTPTASSIALFDANSNLSAKNLIDGYATTTTAAGTTTLTVGSNYQQYFTGSTTQTVTLPVVSTLVLGQQYSITNLSSGLLTVQSSGGNTVQAMTLNTVLIVTCIATTGTTATSWSISYSSLTPGGSIAQSIQISNIQTTQTDALSLLNPTLSTSGIQNQYSPNLLFGGHAWNSTIPTDKYVQWRVYASTLASTSANGYLNFDFSNAATSTPSYTNVVQIDGNNALLSVAGTISAAGAKLSSFVQASGINSVNQGSNVSLVLQGQNNFNAAGTFVKSSNTNVTHSSGNFINFDINDKFTETSTAGDIDFTINRNEVSLGSGVHKFASWMVGGTEKFGMLNTGQFTLPVILKNYTVSTLPTGVQGMIAYVTDALTPASLATVVGGGSSIVPVFYNGTNWIVQ